MNIKSHIIPFRVGGPILNPPEFVGRRGVLGAICSAMMSLQNFSLSGEERTGKTSLLFYLARSSAAVIGLHKTHIPVYVNFQDFAEASERNVWQVLADAIAETITQRHPDGKLLR